MTKAQQKMMYSINDIREAFESARDGTMTDYGQPLNSLAKEMLKGNHIYRIGPEDLECYLEDQMAENGELTEEQKEKFKKRARKHIENTETFGESLQICLELAMEEALPTYQVWKT